MSCIDDLLMTDFVSCFPSLWVTTRWTLRNRFGSRDFLIIFYFSGVKYLQMNHFKVTSWVLSDATVARWWNIAKGRVRGGEEKPQPRIVRRVVFLQARVSFLFSFSRKTKYSARTNTMINKRWTTSKMTERSGTVDEVSVLVGFEHTWFFFLSEEQSLSEVSQSGVQRVAQKFLYGT